MPWEGACVGNGEEQLGQMRNRAGQTRASVCAHVPELERIKSQWSSEHGVAGVGHSAHH